MRRRIPRERERWLSAVLIVTAIVGASAAVRFWPVPLPAPVARPLASRAVHVIDAPVIPIADRVLLLLETAEPAETTSSPVRVEMPELAVVDLFTTAPEPEVESGDPADIALVAIPPLASRRLEMPLDPASRNALTAFLPPAVTSRAEPAVAAADGSHAIIELPAVAVARVVTVAGRGIRTGVRATTAVFRAAF